MAATNRVKIAGIVSLEPNISKNKSGAPCANFVLLNTRKWFSKKQQIEIKEDNWFNVEIYGDYVQSLHDIKKGDFVEVVGRLKRTAKQNVAGFNEYSESIVATQAVELITKNKSGNY